MKKKEATGAIGYVMLFTMAIIMVIITLFMLASSKLQTIQHDVDDALADSVLQLLLQMISITLRPGKGQERR